MPPGWEQLLNYGVLGFGAVAVLWVCYNSLVYLFSRDDAKPGYVTQMIEAHIANQRAQKDLYRALVEREDRQQLLCEQHAGEIHAVGEVMSRHDNCARSLFREACAMARTVSQKEWPSSADAVDRHCREMERIIEES